MDRRCGVIALALWLAACGGDDSNGQGRPDEDDAGSLGPGEEDGDEDGATSMPDPQPQGDAGADASQADPDAALPAEEVLARTGGIGRPCSTDVDCEAGQTCHQDTENYISHGQCVVHCTSTAACEAEFGQETMCIGAEVCVAECLSDDDCPEKTRCNEAGWCARTGPGSGNPYCSGTPNSCSGRGTSECLLALGCTDQSECGGVARSCYAIFDGASCYAQDGCYWNGSDCSGSAYSCTSQFSAFSCDSQDGCSWDAACSGTPDPCESMAVSICTLQPGCFVVDGD